MSIPWRECPTIEIDLDQPWPEATLAVSADRLEKSRRLLLELASAAPSKSRSLEMHVSLRTGRRFDEEMQAFARAIGVETESVVAANLSYDLLLAQIGCSTMALATPEGPVLARNMDWFPENLLAQASCLVKYHRRGEPAFAAAGWAGATGLVTGMSAKGFAVALNAVLSPEGSYSTGYPVLLHLRRVVEDAADFRQAREMLTYRRLASPALFTLVGRTNDERLVIERSPKTHAVRKPRGDKPLVATNDYRLLFRPAESSVSELTRTTCHRYDALCSMLPSGKPVRDYPDGELLYLLTDARVMQSITAQHVIARPAQGRLRLFVPRRLVADE